MKGFIYFLLALAAVAIGAAIYFHRLPAILHGDVMGYHLGNSPETSETPDTPTAPLVSGAIPSILYLTRQIQVPNKFGTISYPRGTMVQFVSEDGGKLTVSNAGQLFIVTPDLVSGGPGSVTSDILSAHSLPSQTPSPTSPFASSLSSATDLLHSATHALSSLHIPSLPYVPALPAAFGGGQFGRYAKYLLIAEGSEGLGSGCLVNYQGKIRVFTNAHIISGNGDVRFTQLDSQVVPNGPFSFANSADLAVADQDRFKEGLEVMTDVDQEVSVGDDVVVLGNSLGSGVDTEIDGKVTGIGPNLVEVDAKFVQGNSGSPIIHVRTGKVIGLATFATQRNLNSLNADSQFNSGWRRFGYRLDTVKSWQRASPAMVTVGAAKVDAVKKMTESLFAVGREMSNGGHLTLAKYEAPDNPIRHIVEGFFSDQTGYHSLSLERGESRSRFLRALASASESDLTGLRRQDFIWFHWNEIQQESHNRDFLKKTFEKWAAASQSYDQPLR